MTEPEIGEYLKGLLRFINANKTADTIGAMLVIFEASGICHYGVAIDPSAEPHALQALQELVDRLSSDSTVTRL